MTSPIKDTNLNWNSSKIEQKPLTREQSKTESVEKSIFPSSQPTRSNLPITFHRNQLPPNEMRQMMEELPNLVKNAVASFAPVKSPIDTSPSEAEIRSKEFAELSKRRNNPGVTREERQEIDMKMKELIKNSE